MVNSQAYILSVQNLTGEETFKDLAQFCRRWLAENCDKLSSAEADRILNLLDPTRYTLGCVCVFLSKISKINNETELLESLAILQNLLPSFDAQQLHWAPDLYNAIFEQIVDVSLKKNIPMCAISILENGILTYTRGNPQYLTNIHALLLCICLKARHFDTALPFLQVDVVELFKQSDGNSAFSGQHDGDKTNGVSSSEGSSQQQTASITSSAVSFLHKAFNTVSGNFGIKSDEMKSTQPLLKRRMVLLYFYYGALVYGALERWEEAVLFLEHAICLPTKKNSAIVLEALKKFIIISLIIGRQKPLEHLPGYRSPVIQRIFLSLAHVYVKIPNMIQRSMDKKLDIVAILTDYLNEKRSVFAKDKNIGLMKVLINVCRENSVKRLGNIFVSLNLNDVSRLAHLLSRNVTHQQAQNLENVEEIILYLCQNKQLAAHIDNRTQTVHFAELRNGLQAQQNDKSMNDTSKLDIDAAMTDVIQLAHVVRAFDDAIRLNPHFIAKCMQKSGKGGTGGNGGGGHGFGMIFPEDEGFYLTSGSP